MYRELAYGGVQNRGTLEAWDPLEMFKGIFNGEVFYSHFGYEEQSMESDRIIDHIVVDIDTLDVDIMRAVLDRITGLNMTLYFSGSKGFHLVLPNVWLFMHDDIQNGVIRDTLCRIFPEADPKIYHHKALIRMPNTVNAKSGLFKREIEPEMLDLGIDAVKKAAETIGPISDFPAPNTLWQKNEPKPHMSVNLETGFLPSPRCIHAILRNPPVRGNRHASALRLFSHLIHYDHYDTNSAIAVVEKWWAGKDGNITKTEFEDLIRMERDVREKYKYGCNDENLSRLCDPACAFYKLKDYSREVKISISQVYQQYVDKISNFEYFDFAEIFPEIDEEFIILDSDLVGIIGPPGSGKSTLAVDMIMKILIKNPDMHVIVQNLDNGHELFVRRCIQWLSGLGRSDVLRPKDKNKELIKKAINLLEHNVSLMEQHDLSKVEEHINNWEKYYPNKPGILLIDHVGNLATKEDGYTRMRVIGDTLKRISKKMDILVIAISHIRKRDSLEGVITAESARDANIGEASDLLIGVAKTEFIAENETAVVRITSPKSRDNKPFNIMKVYNHTNFRFLEYVPPKKEEPKSPRLHKEVQEKTDG